MELPPAVTAAAVAARHRDTSKCCRCSLRPHNDLKMRRTVGTATNGRRTPVNGSHSVSPKISPRNRRSKQPALSKLAVAAFGAFAVVFLLGIHLFLFRAITLNETARDSSPTIPFEVSTDEIRPITLTPLRDVDLELYTIRINTWQRLEQLLVSIEHHSTCPGVAQIQVVWCEEKDPPQELQSFEKVVVERHVVNSLNERFHILEETPTLGILSIDDDVLRPCEAIDSGMLYVVTE